MEVTNVLRGAERREGWEERLAAAVQAALHKPYVLGEHDCFRFACSAIEALTGRDVWPSFKGQYKTKRDALIAIAAYGANFTQAASAFFGQEPVSWRQARRGDLMEFADDVGEKHLGVCVGPEVAVLTVSGLRTVQLDACAHCWRVG